MRLLVAALTLSACASSTVPQSEACREILTAQCDAEKACCARFGAECASDPNACMAHEQQVCPGETGEIDSTKLEGCLTALDNYTCSIAPAAAPMFDATAMACIAMYP